MAFSAGTYEVIQALDRLLDGATASPGAQTLHLVTTATLAQGVLAKLLPQLMAILPDLTVQVEISRSAEVITAVADGTAQAGLLDHVTPHASLGFQVVRRNEAHVVLRRDHPLAVHTVLNASLLGNTPLIALPRRFSLRARTDRAYQEAGLQPRIVMECATAILATEMVSSGIGVSILNPFPLQDMRPDLIFRPFTPATPIETALIYPSIAPPKPIVRQLIKLLGKMDGGV